MMGCYAGFRGVTGIVAALVQRFTGDPQDACDQCRLKRHPREQKPRGNAREQIGMDSVAVPWFCVTLSGERQHAFLDARLSPH
jgi:hypothetical protein